MVYGAGNHTVIVTLTGDTNYENAVGSATFDIAKVDPVITISEISGKVGDNVEVTVTIAGGDATGFILYNGAYYPVENGIATIEIIIPKAGENTLTVNYTGDSKYNNATKSVIYTADKRDSELNIYEIVTDKNNNKTSITVILSDSDGDERLDVTGTVTVTVKDGDTVIKTVESIYFEDSIVTIDLGEINPGKYNFTAVYNGDDNYKEGSNATVEYIIPLVTNVDLPITVYDIVYNESDVYIEVELPDSGLKDNLTIDVNGITYSKDDFEQYGNQVILTLTGLDAGDYPVMVIFENNVYSLINETSFTVAKADVEINPVVTGDKVVDGEVNITFTVPKVRDGVVTVTIDGI